MDELSDLAGAVEAFAEPVGHAVRTDRLIAPVAVLAAGHALFLDVGDLAIGAHFAVSTGHTPARQGREAEESDETHKVPTISFASGVPRLAITARRIAVVQNTAGISDPAAVQSPNRRESVRSVLGRAWMAITKRLDHESKATSRHADWTRDVLARRRALDESLPADIMNVSECKRLRFWSVDTVSAHLSAIWHGH